MFPLVPDRRPGDCCLDRTPAREPLRAVEGPERLRRSSVTGDCVRAEVRPSETADAPLVPAPDSAIPESRAVRLDAVRLPRDARRRPFDVAATPDTHAEAQRVTRTAVGRLVDGRVTLTERTARYVRPRFLHRSAPTDAEFEPPSYPIA